MGTVLRIFCLRRAYQMAKVLHRTAYIMQTVINISLPHKLVAIGNKSQLHLVVRRRRENSHSYLGIAGLAEYGAYTGIYASLLHIRKC